VDGHVKITVVVSDIKGLLGYDVLRHFIATLDYQGGHMHIVAP
jgi:hypothetical protein